MGRRTQAPQTTRAGDHRTLDRPGQGPRAGQEEETERIVSLGTVFVRTVGHFWPYFSLWLSQLPDTRDQRLITYDRKFLAWWGLLLFALKLRSRRQLDFDLRDPESCVLSNVNRLARTRQETLPVSGTLEHFLRHVGAAPFAG